MTKRNNKSSKKQNTPLPSSAGQLYLDRLNKMRRGPTSAPGNTAGTNKDNRPRNTSSSDAARKSRKGFRPG